MRTLTVLYDASCELCLRCREWMESQRSFIALEFVASVSDEAKSRFGAVPSSGAELVVVADDGRVWVGSAAFVVCLWALGDWREWSYRFAAPELAPIAERFFRVLSAKRRKLGALLSHQPCASDACPAYARGPYR